MIIEIYGLPGAGKTTLAKKISETAGYKIIKVRSKSELFFYNLKFLIKHPVKFGVLLYFVVANSVSGRMFYHKLMNCFLHPNARLEKAAGFPKAVVDQGHILNIWAVFERPLLPKEVRQYLKYAVKPDLLIVLSASRDLIAKRADKRGYFARDNFSPDYQKNWQAVMVKNDLALKEALKQAKINYCLVEASQETEEIYKEISAKI